MLNISIQDERSTSLGATKTEEALPPPPNHEPEEQVENEPELVDMQAPNSVRSEQVSEGYPPLRPPPRPVSKDLLLLSEAGSLHRLTISEPSDLSNVTEDVFAQDPDDQKTERLQDQLNELSSMPAAPPGPVTRDRPSSRVIEVNEFFQVEDSVESIQAMQRRTSISQEPDQNSSPSRNPDDTTESDEESVAMRDDEIMADGLKKTVTVISADMPNSARKSSGSIQEQLQEEDLELRLLLKLSTDNDEEEATARTVREQREIQFTNDKEQIELTPAPEKVTISVVEEKSLIAATPFPSSLILTLASASASVPELTTIARLDSSPALADYSSEVQIPETLSRSHLANSDGQNTISFFVPETPTDSPSTRTPPKSFSTIVSHPVTPIPFPALDHPAKPTNQAEKPAVDKKEGIGGEERLALRRVFDELDIHCKVKDV
jgi:hypothetical protein